MATKRMYEMTSKELIAEAERLESIGNTQRAADYRESAALHSRIYESFCRRNSTSDTAEKPRRGTNE